MNEMSLHVQIELVEFSRRPKYQGNEDSLDGSVISLARLDAWIASVSTCLMEMEMQGGHRQGLYTST